jgi:hypothetical protein
VASDDVLKATIATLQAAGLDVSINTEGGVVEVVVTDATTGERYVVRDLDPCGGERNVQLHRSRWGSG